jgi:hypothetical protein
MGVSTITGKIRNRRRSLEPDASETQIDLKALFQSYAESIGDLTFISQACAFRNTHSGDIIEIWSVTDAWNLANESRLADREMELMRKYPEALIEFRSLSAEAVGDIHDISPKEALFYAREKPAGRLAVEPEPKPLKKIWISCRALLSMIEETFRYPSYESVISLETGKTIERRK